MGSLGRSWRKLPAPAEVLLAQLAWESPAAAVSGGGQAPIGLAFLASTLRRIGLRVVFGLLSGSDDIRALLDRFRPRVLGLGATGSEVDGLLRVARSARERKRAVRIIAGGYCSGEPERLLQDDAIDAVVIGEGEATILDLVPRLLAGSSIDAVPGIAHRGACGSVVRTAARPAVSDLDALPLPVYSHDPPDTGMIRIYASRGCPFECTFCRIKDYYATSRIRFHGAEYVRRWIRALVGHSATPVQVVYFNDDEFLLDHRHFDRMCTVVRELGLHLCFQTRTGDILRHASLVERHADVIHQVHLGVESFSPSQLSRWRKLSTADVNRRALQTLAGFGCSYYPYIILTDAFTTPAEIEASVASLVRLPPCPVREVATRARDFGTLSPLHSGLHLNRMKTFRGRLERRPETSYLEAVWCYLERTQAAAERMASLCRDSVVTVPRLPWPAGARWLEERLLQLPSLARHAASAQTLEHGLRRAADLADRLVESANGHALQYLASRVIALNLPDVSDGRVAGNAEALETHR